jgi:hypothetical protein
LNDDDEAGLRLLPGTAAGGVEINPHLLGHPSAATRAMLQVEGEAACTGLMRAARIVDRSIFAQVPRVAASYESACRRSRISGTLSRKIGLGSIFIVTRGDFRGRTAFRDAGFARHP